MAQCSVLDMEYEFAAPVVVVRPVNRNLDISSSRHLELLKRVLKL